MEGIEISQGMSLSQIATKGEDLVLQVDPNIGLPVVFEFFADQPVVARGEMAFSLLAVQSGVDLGVSDLCGCDRSLSGDQLLNQLGPWLGNEALDERAGGEIIHRRSSRMIAESGGLDTLTRLTFLRGGRVGSVRRP